MGSEAGTWSVTKTGADVIRVEFRGYIVAEDGAASARRCAELFGDASMHIVVDAPEFEGYDSRGRVAWQRAMWPLRKQIRSVTLWNKKPLVRMGVTAFGLFVGVRVVTVDTREDLERVITSYVAAG